VGTERARPLPFARGQALGARFRGHDGKKGRGTKRQIRTTKSRHKPFDLIVIISFCQVGNDFIAPPVSPFPAPWRRRGAVGGAGVGLRSAPPLGVDRGELLDAQAGGATRATSSSGW